MSLESGLAKAFGLSGEDAWRRHANPWSVYTVTYEVGHCGPVPG